jgi:uncharacterized NAD(P)/FAD-binding protein YdhS
MGPRRTTRPARVAIVGGGAAGALVAAGLLRDGRSGLRVTVYEPRAEVGLGVAYSTREPWHRLNVPATGMSAVPGEPDHFRAWAGAAPEAFLPRLDYGRYLRAVLADVVAGAEASLEHVRGRVVRLDPREEGVRVTLSTGQTAEADAAVIATGNEVPARLPWLDGLADDARVIADPWPPGALAGVDDGETVAVIGSSLTAIDVAGSLLVHQPRTTVVALSRHGDLPRPHEDPWRPRLPDPVFTLEEFAAFEAPLEEAAARIRVHGADWPRALDSIRPISQALWLAMDERLRREFVTDYRHEWDIHRHRVAAEIARDLDAWIAAGRLTVRAAAFERAEPAGGRIRIGARDGAWTVDRVVVAAGPNPDARANPLLAAGLDDGWLRPGPLGFSIDSDPTSGRVLDHDGRPTAPVYTLGALRRGVLWETLAIPEIRDQAAEIAARILTR